MAVMNIKIIEPYHFNKRYDVRSLTPSLGPVSIASWLNQNGHQAEVISEYVSKIDFGSIHSADLVGISITTYNAVRGFEIAKQINKPIVFGGFHASLMPEECLRYGDYVIRGDGHSIVQLADFLSYERGTDLHRIPNLVYKNGKRVLYNSKETKALDIVPDFRLVRDYYGSPFRRLFRIPLLVNASRGCLWDCTFCAIKEVYPDFRKKSKEVIIQDIESQVKNQHPLARLLPRVIWITDDNFFSDTEWAKDVLRAMAELKTGYKFNVQARVEIAHDDELLDLMRKAQIGFVSLGIESLDQTTLCNFNKGLSLENIRYAIKRIRARGMDVHGLFVFGDDEFRKGDGLKVAEFTKRFKLSGVLIQPLTPFPGTSLFSRLKAENRILSENWGDYGGKVVFQPRNMSPAELMGEIGECYKSIYSPTQLIRFPALIRRGFRLILLGIAGYRHLEWLKCKKYISEVM